MADVLPEKPKEVKAPSKVTDLRNKSIHELAKEAREFAVKKPKLDEKPPITPEKAQEEKPKGEESKKEAPKEVVTPVTPVAPQTPPTGIDEEKIADKAADKTVEKITKIVENNQQTEQQKAARLDALKLKWEREGKEKPDSWRDVIEEAKRLAKAEAVDEAKQWYIEQDTKRYTTWKTEQDAIKQKETLTQKQTEEIRGMLQSEIKDLETHGKIPKIVDINNPNDRGVKVQNALLQKQFEINQERIKQGQEPIRSPKIIFYEHFEDPDAQPAGADAPVVGATSVATQASKPTVQQLRTMSLAELAKQVAKNKVQRKPKRG